MAEPGNISYTIKMNDEQFKSFAKSFETFSKSVDGLSGKLQAAFKPVEDFARKFDKLLGSIQQVADKFKDVNDSVGTVSTNLGALDQSVNKVNTGLENVADSLNTISNKVNVVTRNLGKANASARQFASSMKQVVSALGIPTSLTELATKIASAIPDLLTDAIETNRKASGTGRTYQQYKGTQIAGYGTWDDIEGAMRASARARYNIAGAERRPYQIMFGNRAQQVLEQSDAQFQLMLAFTQRTRGLKDYQVGGVAERMGMYNIATPEDVIRYRRMSPSELKADMETKKKDVEATAQIPKQQLDKLTEIARYGQIVASRAQATAVQDFIDPTKIPFFGDILRGWNAYKPDVDPRNPPISPGGIVKPGDPGWKMHLGHGPGRTPTGIAIPRNEWMEKQGWEMWKGHGPGRTPTGLAIRRNAWMDEQGRIGSTSNVPHFQSGGIVMEPTIGVLGEKGPEAVVPLKGPHLTGTQPVAEKAARTTEENTKQMNALTMMMRNMLVQLPQMLKQALTGLGPAAGTTAGPLGAPSSGAAARIGAVGQPFAGATSAQPAPTSAELNAKASTYMSRAMKDLNLTKNQAAGAFGWMMGESRLRPGILGPHGDTGWMQWVGKRKQDLYATSGVPFGRNDMLTDEMNYQFFLKEMRANPGWLRNLRQTNTYAEATWAFGRDAEGAGGTPKGLEGNYNIHLPFAARAAGLNVDSTGTSVTTDSGKSVPLPPPRPADRVPLPPRRPTDGVPLPPPRPADDVPLPPRRPGAAPGPGGNPTESAVAAASIMNKYPNWMDPNSRKELGGVNAELARDFLAASEQTGYHFKVTQGLRTKAEAEANARSGKGVSDSQHLYGAAMDFVALDAQGRAAGYAGQKALGEAYARISASHGGTGRWLGDLSGKWGRDIVHVDQGIGYGQGHGRTPYDTTQIGALSTTGRDPTGVVPGAAPGAAAVQQATQGCCCSGGPQIPGHDEAGTGSPLGALGGMLGGRMGGRMGGMLGMLGGGLLGQVLSSLHTVMQQPSGLNKTVVHSIRNAPGSNVYMTTAGMGSSQG